jgi:hypothetical protein
VQGEFVTSPEFEGFGNPWFLRVFPGGCDDAEEGMVSIGLENRSNKAIEIDFCCSINDGNVKQVAYGRSATPYNFAPMGSDDDEWGFKNFTKRSKLMSSLVNGALVIQVHMRLVTPTKSVPPPFIPENPVAKMIQGLFLNDKSSDIVFEVAEGKGKNSAMKVARTSPVTFSAHRLIVENSSTVLADLCETHDNGTTPIQINDVTPDVFRLMLSYIYGVKISENDMKSHAREIIDAADKYGVVSLKLESEAILVEGTTFTIENVMEYLLYAESTNCALLKEVSMDYIVENKAEVINKLSFANAPGTLVTDVLAAVSRGERVAGGSGGDGDDESRFNAMRISELRKRVHENGLNVDGSREMLIAALKSVQEAGVGAEEGSEEFDDEPEEG